MIRAYVRVSSDRQVQDNGTDSQRHAIKGALASEGLAVDVWYEDLGLSGKSMGRPAMDRLVADLGAGDTVIAYSLSRLGRTPIGLLQLLETIRDKGARLRLLKESADTSTPTGRLYFLIAAGFAELEREQIIERTSTGLAARKAKGLPLGAACRTKPLTPGAKTGYTKILPEQWADVIKGRDMGLTLRELAEVYGATPGYICKMIRVKRAELANTERDGNGN